MENIKSYVKQHKDRFINELIELLKIPSISADSAYSQDVLNTADAIKTALEKAFTEISSDIDPKSKMKIYKEVCWGHRSIFLDTSQAIKDLKKD